MRDIQDLGHWQRGRTLLGGAPPFGSGPSERRDPTVGGVVPRGAVTPRDLLDQGIGLASPIGSRIPPNRRGDRLPQSLTVTGSGTIDDARGEDVRGTHGPHLPRPTAGPPARRNQAIPIPRGRRGTSVRGTVRDRSQSIWGPSHQSADPEECGPREPSAAKTNQRSFR